MTILDQSKLKRILTQLEITWGHPDEMHMAQAIWSAAQAEQREADAVICDDLKNYFGYQCAAAIRGQK